ncbi:MAG TPA: hypothetical protein VJ183_03030 [Chloroflexia bacterium]|nr:hypothetical protein [Chloroflexia bacterium]
MSMNEKVRLVSIRDVLEVESSWGDSSLLDLHCPVCGHEYNHPLDPIRIDGEDSYKAGWPGRGDLLLIPVEGECGHLWELCIGFHKGQTAIFVRVSAS